MKAVPGILPTLLEMIYFFSTPTIDVEPFWSGTIFKYAQKVRKTAVFDKKTAVFMVAGAGLEPAASGL